MPSEQKYMRNWGRLLKPKKISTWPEAKQIFPSKAIQP
jgi:hypothetical protein